MPKCEKCDQEGTVWEIDTYDGTSPDKFIFCDKHAGEFGFCLGCGHFWGGVESYEFGEGAKYHYCSECWEALKSELECDYEDEDNGYYY